MEEYRTVSGQAIAEIEEKKSRFIGHIAFADTEEKALAFLESVRAEHRTANHNVYAYLLREGSRMRYSDDGEPQKTSGLPTLDAIRHAGLTDCIIVTTRYFGGTLLGTGGLVRAYTQAANAAIAAARVVTVSVCVQGQWRVSYAQYETAAKLLAECGAQVQEAEFGQDVCLPFLMLAEHAEDFRAKAVEFCRGTPDLTLSKPFYAPF